MGNKEDIWRTVAVSIFSALMALITAWVTFGSKAITEEKVMRLVEDHSPYSKDQKAIQETMDSMRTEVRGLRNDVDQMKLEQARASSKLDMIANAITGSTARKGN